LSRRGRASGRAQRDAYLFATRVTYRLGVRLAALIAVLVAVTAVLLGRAATSPDDGHAVTTARLLLDRASFRPELAVTPEQRQRGLMSRRRAPADGMLFVFPEDTEGGFWMKNTLVPLTIVFFDARGFRVRKLSMTPCRRDPCPLYDPGRLYRFALELRAKDPRPARTLGPLAELRRLSRRAS
jgi:uncharacterized protein